MIPSNLTRCTQNDTTAISPGIDQKNILFLHESSICLSASFKTTVSSLCWLATAPAYLWTTHPGGEKKNHQTWGVFLVWTHSSLVLLPAPCILFFYWVCLIFLMSIWVVALLSEFSKIWPPSQNCGSALEPTHFVVLHLWGRRAENKAPAPHSWFSAAGEPQGTAADRKAFSVVFPIKCIFPTDILPA